MRQISEMFTRSLAVSLQCWAILAITSSVSVVIANPLWATTTLSQARSRLAATTVGSQAVFAGGLGSAADSAVVDIYDGASWTTATLSQARYSLAATTLGSQAIFAGGLVSTAVSAVVDIYNGVSWTTATLSQARASPVATTLGSRAIFAGGGGPGVFAAVDIYNGVSWTTATLSQARAELAATTVGSQAVFAGGFNVNFGGSSAVVDIYDGVSWTTATLSQARLNPAATTLGSQAIFAGGHTALTTGVFAAVDIYNGVSWTTATLSQARSYLTATTVGSQAIFAGGTGSAANSAVVDIYNGISWTAATMSQARSYLAATTLGSQAIFAGGSASASSAVVDLVAVVCSGLNVNNSMLSAVSGSVAYPNSVTVSCSTGYVLAGSGQVTCGPNGQFDTSPTCNAVVCSGLNVINGNLNVPSGSVSYPSTITVTCQTGYQMSGQPTVLCNANSLFSATPTCNGVICSGLSVSNGVISATSVAYPNSVAVSCAPGYTLDGSNTVTCGADAHFGTAPTCIVSSGTPPSSGSGSGSSGSSTNVNAILGSVGGAVAAGIVGLAFWKFKITKEQDRAREKYPLANRIRRNLRLALTDFESDKGVEFVNAVQLLIDRLAKVQILVQAMDREELDDLAEIVAKEITTLLVPPASGCGPCGVGCCGGSELPIRAFKHSFDAIAPRCEVRGPAKSRRASTDTGTTAPRVERESQRSSSGHVASTAAGAAPPTISLVELRTPGNNNNTAAVTASANGSGVTDSSSDSGSGSGSVVRGLLPESEEATIQIDGVGEGDGDGDGDGGAGAMGPPHLEF